MSYCNVICAECQGDMTCLTCEPDDSTICPVCSTEITYPLRDRPETFDPEKVRGLVAAILDSPPGIHRPITAWAQAVRKSERK